MEKRLRAIVDSKGGPIKYKFKNSSYSYLVMRDIYHKGKTNIFFSSKSYYFIHLFYHFFLFVLKYSTGDSWKNAPTLVEHCATAWHFLDLRHQPIKIQSFLRTLLKTAWKNIKMPRNGRLLKLGHSLVHQVLFIFLCWLYFWPCTTKTCIKFEPVIRLSSSVHQKRSI